MDFKSCLRLLAWLAARWGALAQHCNGRHVACAIFHCAGLSVGALAQRLRQVAGVRCVAYVITYRAVHSGVHWLSVTVQRETCRLRRCPLRWLERGCTGSASQTSGRRVKHVACAVVHCAGLSVGALAQLSVLGKRQS